MSGEKKKQDFPDKVTEDNLPQLVERAEKIKKRAFWLIYPVTGLYVVIGLFLVLPLTFLVVGWFLNFACPNLSTELFDSLLYVVSFVFTLLIFFVLLDWLIWLFERFLGLPKSEEKVFAGCFLVAKQLMKGEREKALKESRNLNVYLSSFLSDRNIGYERRKAYSPEFGLLIKGRTQISRMLLFSKEDVAKSLTNFGLSFVRHEHHEAFSNLKDLVSEVKKYGEPRGRFSRFLAFMSQIKVLLEAVTAIVGIILIILKLLGVI